MPYQGRIQDFRKGGGGDYHERRRRELSRGSGGYAPPEMFENLSLKMAISSSLRQISYSFNTNFLLVNFVFIK